MNYDERTLLNRLNKLGLNRINLRDIYVTILYMEYLEDMQAFLIDENYNNGLRNILGNDYRLVQPALEDPQILVNLCRKFNGDYALQAILQDTMNPVCRSSGSAFFTPKIQPGLNPQQQITELHTQFLNFCQTNGYLQYAQEALFDEDMFRVFRNAYVRTFQAFPIILNNYKRSITLCCQRVIQDWNDINRIFLPQLMQNITYLTEIKSTGSDAHKGGLEVLILTFNYQQIQLQQAQQVPAPNIQIVYKPRDIEIDALICGNSGSLINTGCLQNNLLTLFDYLNLQIINYNQQNNTNLQPLFTYKFLPKSYGSLPNSNIENAYGYVEFLSYEEQDFNIQQSNNPRGVVENFYTSIGQLMAVTALFSICDIHKDNLLVHAYQPCLVDSENSLVNRCTHLSRVGFVQKNSMCVLRGTQSQNRLFDGQNIITPEPYFRQMQQGFACMSQIIYDFVNPINNLQPWFNRLANVVTRQVPIATGEFVYKQREIFNYQNCRQPIANIQNDLNQYFTYQENQSYARWHQNTVALLNINENTFVQQTNDQKIQYWEQHMDEIILPTFITYNRTYILTEYTTFDIPAYYHRLYTRDLLDYQGTQMQIDPNGYVQQQQLNTFSNLMVSTMYFCYPNNLSPTAVIIRYQLQVDQGTFNNNVQAFIAQLQHFLQNPQQYQ